MKNHVRVLTTLSWALLICAAVNAEATPITNTTGLAAPQSTITFSEVALPNLTPLTTQYAAFGVTFSGLYVDSTFALFSGAANYQNGCSPTPCAPFDVFFTQAASAAAFRLATATGTVTFQALLNGSLVESFVASTLLPAPPFTPAFFGFQGILFNQIHVIPNAGLNGVDIDNIEFNAAAPQAAPEPGTILLFGAGLALAAARWRWVGQRPPR